MTRNTMGDLSNHMFAELERLGDEDLSPEQLEAEIQRARAIATVASRVIESADVVLRAAEFEDRKLDADLKLPPMLGGGNA